MMEPGFREQLRTFHLTGAGLEEYVPAGPLRPIEPHAVRVAQLAAMYGAAVSSARGPARAAMRARVRDLHRGLVNLLAADDAHGDQAPEALVASTELFDTGALAVAVRKAVKGPLSLAPERRARLEQAAAVLDKYLRDSATAPLFWLFSPGAEVDGIEAAGGRCVPSSSPSSALSFCRQAMEEFTAVMQAMAVARAETKSAAPVDNAAALPAVALLAESLQGLSDAAHWNLPLQLLIACRDVEGADWGAVAMAHRVPFVVQETWTESERLKAELRDMAAFEGPAVAVISEAGDGPLFAFDPRGESWAQRLRFHAQTAAPASVEVAAGAPAWRLHFRVLPEAVANADQLELTAYLAQWKDRAPAAIPYIPVPGGRAVMTRDLAHRCRERQRARRALEEIAGIGNSFVDQAVAHARAECEQAAAAREQSALETGRQEGARLAVGNLMSALLAPRGAATPKPPAAAPAIAPVKTAMAPTAAPTAVAEAPADPYIDSFLCTSCNDCMKVNPKLFLYNSDKQAYLGDPSVGTFAELVKAAEGCPAKCIHPGKPRPGDASATAAVLARAAKLG